jgi:hypothetical protein
MKRALRGLGLSIIFSCFLTTTAQAKRNPQDESKKVLDFDDGSVVEGMNKQPLDSYSQLAEDNAGGPKNHLYKRLKNFSNENRELIREIKETY